MTNDIQTGVRMAYNPGNRRTLPMGGGVAETTPKIPDPDQ